MIKVKQPGLPSYLGTPTYFVVTIVSTYTLYLHNLGTSICNVMRILAVETALRTYTPQINHISMKMPSFPLLSQPESIKNGTFCNESTVRHCSTNFCHCVYKIDLPLHVVVELTLIDEGEYGTNVSKTITFPRRPNTTNYDQRTIPANLAEYSSTTFQKSISVRLRRFANFSRFA